LGLIESLMSVMLSEKLTGMLSNKEVSGGEGNPLSQQIRGDLKQWIQNPRNDNS